MAPLHSARSLYPPSNTLTIRPWAYLSASLRTSRANLLKKLVGSLRPCRDMLAVSCSDASNPALIKITSQVGDP